MPVMVTLLSVIAEAFGFVTVTATWVTVPAVTAESETWPVSVTLEGPVTVAVAVPDPDEVKYAAAIPPAPRAIPAARPMAAAFLVNLNFRTFVSPFGLLEVMLIWFWHCDWYCL